MQEISVRFYIDMYDIFKTMTIEASSREDFNEKLESLMRRVDLQAEENGFELCGVRYKLPEEWQ